MAIPQEVGEHTRNGGVRVTVSNPFTYLEPMEWLFPLAAVEYSVMENTQGHSKGISRLSPHYS